MKHHAWLKLSKAHRSMTMGMGLLLFTWLSCLFFCHPLLAEDSPPHEGNFALPTTQQPGAFLSFGQTLIGRNALQVAFSTYSPFHIDVSPWNDMNVLVTYGITDDLSLYANIPISAHSNVRGHVFHGLTAGFQNVNLQLEQAFYSSENRRYQEQATLVGSVALPLQTETPTKESLSFATPSYFLGATYVRTYVDWLAFVSPGALITQPAKDIQLGSQFLYQAGLGRTLITVMDESDLFILLEFNGQYTTPNEILGSIEPNSGGNVISLTPSFALITKHTMTQVGVGFPVVQHLFGNQKPMDFFIAAQLTLSTY